MVNEIFTILFPLVVAHKKSIPCETVKPKRYEYNNIPDYSVKRRYLSYPSYTKLSNKQLSYVSLRKSRILNSFLFVDNSSNSLVTMEDV